MQLMRQLHTIFLPEAYKLELNLDRPGRTFVGVVSIAGRLQKAGRDIVLHSKDLMITKATIDGKNTTHINKGDGDELSLQSAGLLRAGEHVVRIEFSGKITDSMQGLYPCYFKLNGKDEELLATQFESHSAREVFPCIDEPAAKATFNLSLTTESDIAVLSNTPVKTQHTSDSGRLITSFETTPVMSTYLLAWVAGKLDYVQAKTKDGVLVRVYATPDKIQQTKFALDTALKTLEFFNDYFGITYPLAKCDLVALPDFSAGAMENWGCITFRESCLLVDELHTPTNHKQYIAMVIAHELAHQWFGNLVTMQWWDDLWLNESFATWASYLACDRLFPEWQMWTRFFTDETMRAYKRDGLASVQPVRQAVHDPAEITTLFDGAIVYAKGASLLHMLHSYVGANIFQKGLQAYLKKFAYGNATTQDLWQSLSAEANIDIASFMQPWLAKAGHAVVGVHVGAQSTYINQQRFYINPQVALKDDPDLWPVPLMSDGVIKTELLDAHTTSIDYTKSDTPFMLNRGRSGFYLSSYDSKHILKLAESVQRGELTVVDRLGLLSDTLFLSQGGYQPTTQLLQLLKAYRDETSYPVWLIIKDIVDVLKLMMEDTPDLESQLRQFIISMAQPLYTRLGWEATRGETYEDGLLRPVIIRLMCYYQEPDAVRHARSLFERADQPNSIAGNLRSTIFTTATEHGGATEFGRLLDWYKKTTSAEERIDLAAGLSATTRPELTKIALDLLTSKSVKKQDVHYWFKPLMNNPHSRAATWQWLQTNWGWIKENFGNDFGYTKFPVSSAAAFSTSEQLAMYEQFFTPLLDEPALCRSIQQGLEEIESRMLWRQRDLGSVADYLKLAPRLSWFSPSPLFPT